MCSPTRPSAAAGRDPRAGGAATAIAADVSRREEAQRLVQEAVRLFGTVDVLVNNAGILSRTALEAISEDEWDRVMAVNVKGVFLCSQAVFPVMKAKRYGKIVNIASRRPAASARSAGRLHHLKGRPARAHPATSPRELGRLRDHVNSVCPGMMDTELIRENASRGATRGAPRKGIPSLGSAPRKTKPTSSCFLASDAAGYITGASVDINGGDLMI